MRIDKDFIKRHKLVIWGQTIIIFGGVFLLKAVMTQSSDLSVPKTQSAAVIESTTQQLPYNQNSFTTPSSWKGVWGITNPSVDGLELSAASKTNGATSLLAPDADWTDYIYTTNIKWNKGSDITLMARYKDGTDQAMCVFNDTDISVRENVAGKISYLSNTPNYLKYDKSLVNLGISVEGTRVNCYEGSYIAASSTDLDATLDHGGIGLGIWDKTIDHAQITATTVSVAPIDSVAEILKALPSYKITIAKSSPHASPKPSPTVVARVTPPPLPARVLPYYFNVGQNLADVYSYVLVEDQPNPWEQTYGLTWMDGGILNLSAGTTTYGAVALLSDTSDWTDYAFNANINWIKASDILLRARESDTRNFVKCDFSNRGTNAKIYEIRNGVTYPLDQSYNLISYGYSLIWPTGLIGIQVQGNTVSCLRDGKVVVTDTIDTMPAHGGIGFEVSAPTMHAATMDVRSVRVTPL